MGKADLHIHSTYSDGQSTVAHILDYVEHYTDLDVIAITDHDCLDGGLFGHETALRRRLRVEVIPGIEVSTRDGHLLALGVEWPICRGLSMAETVLAIHEQKGAAVVAHPLSRWCPSATLPVLHALASLPDMAPDGLEALNGSFAGLGSNARAQNLNRAAWGWAETGGSDAHTLRAIASSFTRFPGQSTADLLAALRTGATQACGGFWPLSQFVHYAIARDHSAPPSRSAQT